MRNRKLIVALSFLAILCLISSCIQQITKEPRYSPGKGQITVFLNGNDRVSKNITFELVSLEIIRKDGIRVSVLKAPVTINSFELKSRQVLIGESAIPEGNYTKIEMVLKKPGLIKDGSMVELSQASEKLIYDINLYVYRHQNISLFLRWDPDRSVRKENIFKPQFEISGKMPETTGLLMYVTNEKSDNVTVINRHTGQVVATIMVGRSPKGIAVGTLKNNLKVFVVNSGSNSISIIDPSTNTVENEVPISSGGRPADIAVAQISAGKDLIFVTNPDSNTVTILDSSTYGEIQRVDVGFGPVRVIADPPVETVLGSRFLSASDISLIRSYRRRFLNVYVANRVSNSVSILRVDKNREEVEEIITIDVEWEPVALYLDYQRAKLYVANYGSDKVSVIDIIDIINGRESEAVTTINNTGYALVDIIADPLFDRLYLLRESPAEMVVLRPYEDSPGKVSTTVLPVISTVSLEGTPSDFILDPERNKIYIVNKTLNRIEVIDKTTYRIERIIPVGESPDRIGMFTSLLWR